MIRHNLNDAEPDVITDLIASELDELKNDVYVPRQVHSKLFRKDGNTKHQLFPDSHIGAFQVRNEL